MSHGPQDTDQSPATSSGLRLTASALALLVATVVAAQNTTSGSISGRVLDDSRRPLADATVVISSSQGATRLTTGPTGRFLAPYVTPGSYTVRADAPGFRPAERHGLEVRLGQRASVEIALVPDAFSETVDVSAALPVLDMTSTAAGLTIDTGALAHVPVGRGLADTIHLAPGVSDSGGAGRSNPSIAGASGLENRYMVDGVDITNSRYGALGVYSSEYGSLGNGVSYDFVDDVRVLTAGAGSELAQSTGGIVAVTTKSGSNELVASVYGYASPEPLEGRRRKLDLANGAVETTGASSREYGATVGGPIVRDRLFAFVAAGRRDVTTTFLAPDGFPLRSLGEVDRDRSVTSYAAKLTALAADGHRFELSAFGDPTDGDTGPQSPDAMRFRSTSAFSSLAYGGHAQSLRYQGVVRPSWLVEASLAHAASAFKERVSVDEWQVTDETVTPVQTTGGKGRFEAGNDGDSRQLRARSSHLFGRHELQWGIGAERTSAESERDITGPAVVLADGGTTATGALVDVISDPVYGRIYRVTRAELQRARSSDGRFETAFVQDRVVLGTRWTVEAGLRWERQKIEGTGAAFGFGDSWAPRVGVAWDPRGDGRSKLYASYGVAFARIPNSLAISLLGTGGRVRRADYFDAALTQPIPDGVAAGGTTGHLVLSGTEPARFDPDAEVTSTRRAVVGYEWVTASDLTLGLRYVHRDMPQVLEDVTTASLWLTFVGTDDVEYLVTNPSADDPATVDGIGRFVDPVHRYDALELTAEKRFADGWSLLASYRFSRLEGNYEGFYRNDTDQSSPAITSIFDFPPDDPTYAGIGVPELGFRGDIRYLAETRPLPNDRPHQLKLFASYRFDRGLGLGVSVNASSGRPLTPMAVNPVYGRAGEIPEAPRGSGIETEDGFVRRTPDEWGLDLHVDYEIATSAGRVVLLLDVFNLLDRDGVVDYDQNTERDFGVPNPDFGRRIAHQAPRSVRLGIRFEL